MLVAYSMARADDNTGSDVRPRRFGHGVAALALVAMAGVLLPSGPAAAQTVSDDCKPLVKIMRDHGALMQRLQSMNKQKQKDASQFCSVFQQIGAKVNAAIPEIEKNGSWCHVPENVLPALKASLSQIDKAKGQACGVAAQQKKMQAQQKAQQQQQQKQPGMFGGGDSIVGGPVRMPQGAL